MKIPFRFVKGLLILSATVPLLSACTIPDEDPPPLPEPSNSCPNLPPVVLAPEQETRQKEVDLFLAGIYQDNGWAILQTTRTCLTGDVWDWLDAESVPGSEEPPPPPPEFSLPPEIQLQQTELDLFPEARGPADSVPMRRPTYAPYVFGDVEASSVEDFIVNKQVPGQTEKNLYAGIDLVVSTTGARSFINAYEGKVEARIMSVLEMTVLCQGPNRDTTLEQVGVAASRDRANFDKDDSLPLPTRLQVEFYTAGFKAVGQGRGGWHGGVLPQKLGGGTLTQGFIPAKGAPYGPGVALTPVSTIGGALYDSLFEIKNVGGNWWILHNHNWLGYYPTYSFDLIKDQACEVHYYGEVADVYSPDSWTQSDMGSGRFAAEGRGYAAYFRQPVYYDLNGLPQWPDGAAASTPNDPLCYTSSGLLNEGSPDWERVMYCSGPGGDSPGCN